MFYMETIFSFLETFLFKFISIRGRKERESDSCIIFFQKFQSPSASQMALILHPKKA